MNTNNTKKNHQFFYENLQFEHEYSLNTSFIHSPVSFPTHWHTVGEIILSTSDGTLFRVQQKDYRLNSGDILFVWPGELHSTIHAEPPYLIVQYYGYLLNLFSDLILMQNKVLSRHYVDSFAPDAPAQKIADYMHQIYDITHSQTPLNNLRMTLCFYNILLTFYDYCRASAENQLELNAPRLQTFQTISKACCYIAQNCERDLSLDEVADYVGISKFHFSRSFKEYTQTNFSDYLAKQRIQRAILLFGNPEISIAEAAFQSGFGSIASFNRCFKKEKHCTPSEYRNMFQMS